MCQRRNAHIHQIWRRAGTRTVAITERINLNENYFFTAKRRAAKNAIDGIQINLTSLHDYHFHYLQMKIDCYFFYNVVLFMKRNSFLLAPHLTLPVELVIKFQHQ